MTDAPRKMVPREPMPIAEFDKATEHPYECRCKLCLRWWEDSDAAAPAPADCPDCHGTGVRDSGGTMLGESQR